MTLLQVMPDNQAESVLLRTTDDGLITTSLRSHGVGLSRWEPAPGLAATATGEMILDAYSSKVDQLREDGGYHLVDVVQWRPDDDDPGWAERAAKARGAFRDEHRHGEDEVRFFAAGRGCFYLHLNHHVLAVVCEAGDLLSVPAGTPHWFDMGSRPDFVAIRFFQEEDGWVGDFTGGRISSLFPTLDDLLVAP
jgi:1,2-dihydroxy-3-keto-5-methylthiopentene dioxygenase